MQPTGPMERFMTFVPISSHTGESIADVTLAFLEQKEIDIKFCRGQSYDNASNMSGKYKGVQSRIKEVCKYAEYVPCCAHSLNLVGTCAVESVPEAAALFVTVQKIYVLYSASTKRWKLQEDMIAAHEKKMTVVKKLCETRWSSRHDAVRALTVGFKEHVQLLKEISENGDERAVVQSEARGHAARLLQTETALLLHLWNDVLARTNKTSVRLQTEGCPLNLAVHLLNSLLNYIKSLRDKYDYYEKKAHDVGAADYRMESGRERKKTNFFAEWSAASSTSSSTNTSSTSEETAREFFRKHVYIPIIDQLTTSLQNRIDAYSNLSKNFGFLLSITTLNDDALKKAATNLVDEYPEDLEPELESEIVHFAAIMKSFESEKLIDISKAFEIGMFTQIVDNNLEETFPNVTIMLKIYLCMFVTNCKGERSFSKLKLLKNHLRNTMGQERLASLALLSIENRLLRTIDFTDVIADFAEQKCRRKEM